MYDTIGLIIKAENEIDVMENAKVLMDERTRLDPGEDSEKWDSIICEWYSFFKEENGKLQTYARINSKRGISILSDLLDKGDPRDYKNLEETYPRILNWNGEYIRNDKDFRNIILRQYDITSIFNLWIVPVDIHI